MLARVPFEAEEASRPIVSSVTGILKFDFDTAIGFPAQLLLSYMTQAAMYFGNLPWAIQEVSLSIIGALLLYGVIAALTYYMQRKTGYNLRNSSLVE